MSVEEQRKRLERGIMQITPLHRVLLDEGVTMVVFRGDGFWQVKRDDVFRLQPHALPGQISALIAEVKREGPLALFKDWWLQVLPGGFPGSATFQRRPDPRRASLSSHTVELLRSRLARDGNGIIFGQDRVSRGGLLLSLPRFLPRDLVVYIGSIPPIDKDRLGILHLPFPRSRADREELAPLIQSASTVLFDGTPGREDLDLLLPAKGAQNRWIAVDSKSPRDVVRKLDVSPEESELFQTLIGIRGGEHADDAARLTYLALGSIGVDAKREVLLDSEKFNGEMAQVTRAENPRLSAQMTSPNQRALSASTDEPVTSELHDLSEEVLEEIELLEYVEAASEAPLVQESNDFDVSLLLDDAGEPEVWHRSGEINVPGFVSKRQLAVAKEPSEWEIDEEDADSPTSMLRGERFDSVLPELLAEGGIEGLEIPSLDPERLRQTRDTRIDRQKLDHFRALRRQNNPEKGSLEASENKEIKLEDESSQEEENEKFTRHSISRRVLPSRPTTEFRQRAVTGSQRVLPIPSSTLQESRDSSALPNSSAPSKKESKDDLAKDTGASRLQIPIPPGMDEPLSDATEEFEVGDLLADLKFRRSSED